MPRLPRPVQSKRTGIGFALLWIDGATCFHTHRLVAPEHRNATRAFDHYLAAQARAMGCDWLNIGDGHRAPGLAGYKFALKPQRLGCYVNCLDRQELADYDQPG